MSYPENDNILFDADNKKSILFRLLSLTFKKMTKPLKKLLGRPNLSQAALFAVILATILNPGTPWRS